jgi:hypothetical protein
LIKPATPSGLCHISPGARCRLIGGHLSSG